MELMSQVLTYTQQINLYCINKSFFKCSYLNDIDMIYLFRRLTITL